MKVKGSGVLQTQIDPKPWIEAARGVARSPSRLAWALVGLGIVFRLGQYLTQRALWLDEGSLRANIVGRPVLDFRGPLVGDQLAPPGFLAVERAVSRVLGSSALALRFVPLACGIASLVLFRRLALRCLDLRDVPIAVGLFTVSDDMIYYSTEIKQYTTDVLLAIACSLMALGLASEAWTARRLVGAGALGIVAPWFSHASIFALAGSWAYVVATALGRRDSRRALGMTALAIAWATSFAACYAVSRALLSQYTTMWVFWAFAFPPLPPTSAADLALLGRHALNAFASPVGIMTPLGPMLSAGLGMALWLGGIAAYARSRRAGLLILLLTPAVGTMAASGLHRYPFHGRIILHLVPAAYLLIAAGIGAVGRRLGRLALGLLIVLLFVYPTLQAGYGLFAARSRDFDGHGDLRRDIVPLNPR